MPTFTELLPQTPTSPRGAGFKWTPSEERPGCGLMVIEAPRVSVTYLVCEFATRWDGRSWHLAKVTEGTDKESIAEDVFIGRNRQDRQCTCKGFTFGRGKDKLGHATCKHLESLLSILENRWDGCPVDLDADTGSTERYEMPETI